LSIDALKKIFSIHFVVLQEAWKEKSVTMPHYSEDELEKLIKEKMYEPQYGARPVEQYMNIIEDELIEQVMNR
jgi:ATP-dependent Clp protease ATP-binding subunit ClpA